ncbi:MAG: hypothetical protein Barrevirus34_4 [Barrevirus sp.]|uniref:Uncharacterized protein n=1 Tax=Barrevirus sp. TaxID=2487763 RepID=A0A3G4ZV60_9VIRU|nr:MAG: hypothetical protein Barrevirus34_4 [Barrevirus sp.]
MELLNQISSLSGQELYDKSQIFKKDNDITMYCIYLVMAANYENELAISKLYNEDGHICIIHDQDAIITIPFYKATKHYTHSLNYLATIYKGGYSMLNYQGVKKSEKALQLFTLASNKGNSFAKINLADMYIKNILHINLANLDNLTNLHNNFEKAILLLEEAVKQDNVCAIRRLAGLYSKNNQDNKIIELYQLGLAKGDVLSMHKLAEIYSNQNLTDKVIQVYQEAIKKDDVLALYKLGKEYEYLDKYDEAKELYERAIKKGLKIAIYALAQIYQFKEPIDLEKAKKLYEEIIFNQDILEHYQEDTLDQLDTLYDITEEKDSEKMIYLATSYESVNNHNKVDKWLRRAANVGNVEALLYIANPYSEIIEERIKAKDIYQQIIKGRVEVGIKEKEYFSLAIESLESLYKFDNNLNDNFIPNHFYSLKQDVMTLKKENERLTKENQDMKDHILLQPDGKLFFECLRSFNDKKI